MKNYWLIGITGIYLLVSACSQTESRNISAVQEPVQKPSLSIAEQQAIDKLAWIHDTEVEVDLDKAMNEKDFRLWVVAKRGPNMPGVTAEKQAKLKQNCGVKYLAGMGDLLLGNSHQAIYNLVLQYARSYNKAMQRFCIK